jgi:hypothetical protein
MNVDRILETMNQNEAGYILIGGMNFLLQHAPVLTYDIDFWIDDSPSNLHRCEKALVELEAEWGATEQEWTKVKNFPSGWLRRQPVFYLTSPWGAIDIFRTVKGLQNWQESFARAFHSNTMSGVSYHGLSDEDMLACQLALDPGDQKAERIRCLKAALGS